jgi:hypothetical protein
MKVGVEVGDAFAVGVAVPGARVGVGARVGGLSTMVLEAVDGVSRVSTMRVLSAEVVLNARASFLPIVHEELSNNRSTITNPVKSREY